MDINRHKENLLLTYMIKQALEYVRIKDIATKKEIELQAIKKEITEKFNELKDFKAYLSENKKELQISTLKNILDKIE